MVVKKVKSQSLRSADAHFRAFQFAAEAYQDRRIPGWDSTYIQHASQVAIELLMSQAANPAELDLVFAVQCALLQDILEGSSIKPEQLQTAFGKKISDALLAFATDMSLPDVPPVHLRRVDYLRRIQRQPREIWAVVMADCIVKLQMPTKELAPSQIKRQVEISIAIHAAFHEAHPGMAKRLVAKIHGYMEDVKAII